MNRIAVLALIAPLAICGAQQAPVRTIGGREYDAVQLQRSALEDSLIGIPSSSQRARALRTYGQTNDRGTLLSVMRVARTIPNTTDKSRLLGDLAPRYLSRDDHALSTAFFRVARTVPSSEELRDLLIDIVPFAAKSDDLANDIIELARIVPSSPGRAEVLSALVASGAVRSTDVRENFADALREIPSEQDRQRVIRTERRPQL